MPAMTRGGPVEIEPDFAVRGHVTVEKYATETTVDTGSRYFVT